MPKRTRKTEHLDTVQNAGRVFLEAVQSTESVELTIVQKVMREMGSKGGKIGGKRRLETMTDESAGGVERATVIANEGTGSAIHAAERRHRAAHDRWTRDPPAPDYRTHGRTEISAAPARSQSAGPAEITFKM